MQDSTTSKNTTPLELFGFVLALLGAAVSGYATWHHFKVRASGATDAICNISQKFNCDDVALSNYSELFGIPVAVLGVAFFASLLVLLVTAKAKPQYRDDALTTFFGMTIVGAVTSVVLAIISATAIKVFCPTCMVVYVITFCLLVLVILRKADLPKPMAFKQLSNGSTYVLVTSLVVIAPVQMFKPPAQNLKMDLPQQANGDGQDQMQGSILDPKKTDIPLNKGPFSGLGEDYRWGSDDAKVVIVEFADFECPACQEAFHVLKQMKEQYGDKILVVFKNYPLDNACNTSVSRKIHEFACDAARLARCAGSIGKFAPFHDTVYANQQDLSQQKLRQWATEVGLTDTQINECLKSPDVLAKLQDDVALGNRVGVQGTPTIFINGQKVVGGRSYEAFRSEVEKLLF
ncbi:MAG: thioredoxin domain-containing protein [Oligoflexales bacterium]